MHVKNVLWKLFQRRRAELAACSLGLLLGWGLFADAADAAALDAIEAAPTAEAVTAPDSWGFPEVQEEIFIHELANEFHIDQDIVRIVHEHSKKYSDRQAPEWRLLRSPEAVTYLMLSVINAESRGNPTAVGDDGRARGLTQIHTTTAQLYGKVDAEQLLDPETNIHYSFLHFHALLKRYQGNFPLALYGWNRGPGTVDRLIRYGNSPANHYGRRVYRAAIEKREELRLMGH